MKTGKADKYFSLFIRLRDADENGLARCITCGVVKPVKQMDCGHWIKRQHQNTRFNEINCQTQCKKCNAFEQGRDADFERALIEKYGEDKVNLLKAGKNITIKASQYKLDYLAALYKQKATELSRLKGIALWILIIGFMMTSCQKEPLRCYECESKIMSSWQVIGTTEEEMNRTIQERIRVTGDTMKCVEIICNN